MPGMVSYPRRPQSGHITCYLIRTYHVLTTLLFAPLGSCQRATVSRTVIVKNGLPNWAIP